MADLKNLRKIIDTIKSILFSGKVTPKYRLSLMSILIKTYILHPFCTQGPSLICQDNTVAVLSTGNISIDISESASAEEFLVKLMRAMRYAG